jgi:hypothetical protein
MKNALRTLALSATATGTLAALGNAEPSQYRLDLTRTGAVAALEARNLPLLEVIPPAGGREAQLKRLLDVVGRTGLRRIHVANPGRTRVSPRATFLAAEDGSWYLEVAGDGSRFRYRGNVDDPKAMAAAGSKRLGGPDTLERFGREFIAQHLRSLAPLGDGEALVFMGSKYMHQGSAAEGEPWGDEVVANIAVFSREVGGTFVAGAGSKIAVWFSNTGEPVGFDVDWPAYKVSERRQDTLDIDAVRKRLGSYGDAPLERVDKNMSRFECGYVDMGVYKRAMGLLQTGCFVHHDGPSTDGARYAAVEAIPIGEPVVSDAQWPVTGFIAAGRPWDRCAAQPSSCALPPDPDSELPTETGAR